MRATCSCAMFVLEKWGLDIPAAGAAFPLDLGVTARGSWPYRMHIRAPSFANLQGLAPMAQGGFIADVVAAVVPSGCC